MTTQTAAMDCFTPHEAWYPLKPGHHYQAAADWVGHQLGRGKNRAVLVIGSPLGEARRLAEQGWIVSYLDWREAPVTEGVRMYRGNALALPFPDGSFDAISSTCVLCHVGLGRYGDPLLPQADAQMLSECERVLAPHGVMVGMAGPVVTGEPVTQGMIQRVYTVASCRLVAELAGFMWKRYAIWGVREKRWVSEATRSVDQPDYLAFRLEKYP